MENWLNNDMIGETGMVESFDVSLCLSFIRKKRQQERECGFYIQSRRCNVLRLKCEWMWDWCHGSCGWCRRCVNSVGGVYRRLRNAWIFMHSLTSCTHLRHCSRISYTTHSSHGTNLTSTHTSTSKHCTSLYIKPTLSFLLSFLPDEAQTERNVETFYHSCLTNHVIQKE